jgi:DNA-binding CsgD family transcriptional regulator
VSVQTLSKREQEVVAELRSGSRVQTIARQLSISPTTVRNHLQRIFWKLGVHSQAELIEYVRTHPEMLPPSTGESRNAETEARYWEANARLAAELDSILSENWGPEAIRDVMHRALPLGEAGRAEWRARLALWSREDSSGPELAGQRSAEMESWRSQALERIRKAQAEGWLRSDLGAQAIIEQLFSLLVGVSMQLVVDPGARPDELIRVVDAYVDDLLEGPSKGDWQA